MKKVAASGVRIREVLSVFGMSITNRVQYPITFDYCTTCAIPEHESTVVGGALVSEMNLGATAWVEGNEYVVEKTIKQLAIEREGNR